MLILALNSSSDPGCLALSNGQKELAMEYPRGQGRRIITCLDELLKELSSKKEDLSHLVVCTGPGSFTGIRVGIASIGALGMSLKIPVLGISAFDVIHKLNGSPKKLEIALISGKDQVFSCRYPEKTMCSLSLDKCLEISENIISTGNAVSKYQERFEKAGRECLLNAFSSEDFLFGMLDLAKECIEAKNFETKAIPEALYLRKSTPEEKLATG